MGRIRPAWIFQDDLARNGADARLRAGERAMPWRVNRYNKDILAGDEAFIWMSGKQRGIVAYGKLKSPLYPVELLDVSEREKLFPEGVSLPKQVGKVTIEDTCLDAPLSASMLVAELPHLPVLKVASHIVFKVETDDVPILRQLVMDHLRDHSDHIFK